jgi:cyclopropane fatty-acyl-phospholipid synthase-like methyltransferase
MTMDKPFSPACERNREPILAVLREHFADRRHVLEVGSGTGQHAVHFAAALPHLSWQTSERAEALPGLRLWLDEAACPNTPPPLALDVGGAWPPGRFDAVFTANTLHIMAWDEVQAFFASLPAVLAPGARMIVYGPFIEEGQATAPSNLRFDEWLKAQAPHQGLRTLQAVDALAATAGLARRERLEMPANNLLVVWQAGA